MAVHSPLGGTKFNQYPLAFPLEAKRLKGESRRQPRSPSIGVRALMPPRVKRLWGRAWPLPRHDVLFTTVNQGAGSTGAPCPGPTNWPLFLKMGLRLNSHIGSVMSTPGPSHVAAWPHGRKVAQASAWGPKAMPHPQVPFPSGGWQTY